MIVDPFSALIAFIVASAPKWLADLRGTLLDSAKEQGMNWLIAWLTDWWTRWQERRHFKVALQVAVAKGAETFDALAEKDQYYAILSVLSESAPDELRRQALTLFTLSDKPDFKLLTEKYNLRERIRKYATRTHTDLDDATPYLRAFFAALLDVLYDDDVFKDKITKTFAVRADKTIQEVLPEIARTTAETSGGIQELVRRVGQISEYLREKDYTEEKYQQDLQRYLSYMEVTYKYLRLPTPKAFQASDAENRDAELNAIFVPQHICEDQPLQNDQPCDSAQDLLKSYPHTVLLGGPGTGKSTTLRYLAWSHAAAIHSLSPEKEPAVLPGKPVPLYIGLRRFAEYSSQHLESSFFSYTADVLLRSMDIRIDVRMFETLRATSTPLLFLFDGLDEVAVAERQSLIARIGELAQSHPNDTILVTSRPAGYEGIDIISERSFSLARIQDFTDEQIHTFLAQYYSYIRRRIILSADDKHELEVLYTTLTGNPRLHLLAKNPLLLTIITRMSRSQPLPDRRVRVYDECASWLLEEWARFRGTSQRLRAMKMGTSDQRACVAHLGFLLHKRLQEQTITNGASLDDGVTLEFMQAEIEQYLKSKDRFPPSDVPGETAYFLDLMQTETGLIIRQSNGPDDEPHYRFVHSTFREYFAALDVASRTDEAVFNEFLIPYLHDPHWQEVTFLLFGELRPEPVRRVSYQLRQLLTSDKQCRLGGYSDVVQQNLFFACDCLNEDIAVENTLADSIVSAVSKLIETSPYRAQRTHALQTLEALARTHQYSNKGRDALLALLTTGQLPDSATTIETAQALYRSSPLDVSGAQARQTALSTLLTLISSTNTQEAISAAQAYYECFAPGSPQRTAAIQAFLTRMQAPDVSFEQTIDILKDFLKQPTVTAEEQQAAMQVLLHMLRDTTHIEQARQVVEALSYPASNSQEGLTAWETAAEKLLTLMQGADFEQIALSTHTLYTLTISSPKRTAAVTLLLTFIQPDISCERAIEIAEALTWNECDATTERQQVIDMLHKLRQRPELSTRQKLQIATRLYENSPAGSAEQQEATEMFLALVHQQEPPLTFEDIEELYQVGSLHLQWQQEIAHIMQMLFALAQSSDQAAQVGYLLHTSSLFEPEDMQQATQELLNIFRRSDLSHEQCVQVAAALYKTSPLAPDIRQQAKDYLWSIAQNSTASPVLRLQAATVPLDIASANYIDRAQAVDMIKALVQDNLISEAEVKRYLAEHWTPISATYTPRKPDIPAIYDLAKQELLPEMARNEMYVVLRELVPHFDGI